MKICPVPGCSHLLDFLTNHHCQTVHGMTRKELVKKYGEPREVRPDNQILKKNMKGHVFVSDSSFYNGR